MCQNCDIARAKAELIIELFKPFPISDKIKEIIFNHIRDAIYETHPEYNVHVG